MDFTCTHCGEAIHSLAATIDGKIIHHRCMEAYKKAKEKIEEVLETE